MSRPWERARRLARCAERLKLRAARSCRSDVAAGHPAAAPACLKLQRAIVPSLATVGQVWQAHSLPRTATGLISARTRACSRVSTVPASQQSIHTASGEPSFLARSTCCPAPAALIIELARSFVPLVLARHGSVLRLACVSCSPAEHRFTSIRRPTPPRAVAVLLEMLVPSLVVALVAAASSTDAFWRMCVPFLDSPCTADQADTPSLTSQAVQQRPHHRAR